MGEQFLERLNYYYMILTAYNRRLSLFGTLLLLLVASTAWAQTGPGGVKSTDVMGLWLQSSENVLNTSAATATDGQEIGSWTGNLGQVANRVTNGPLFTADGGADFANLPVISFDNTERFLTITDSDVLDGDFTGMGLFVVFKRGTTDTRALLMKRTTQSTNRSYGLFYNNGFNLYAYFDNNGQVVGPNISAGTAHVASFVFDSSLPTSSRLQLTLDAGTPATASSNRTTVPNYSADLQVGLFQPADPRYLDGDEIAEVILFQEGLNTAQRILVENYLQAKYPGITLGDDFYAGDTPANGDFDFDVAGIGRKSSGNMHTEGSSAGMYLSTYNGSLDANDEFVIVGHDNTTNAVSTTALGTGIAERWARTWYLDKTSPDALDVEIGFSIGEGIAPGSYPQETSNYRLLRWDGVDSYDPVTVVSTISRNDQVVFRVADTNLIDGIYTLGTTNATASPVDGGPQRTWYSYQSGDWSSPTTWTLDGSLTPLFTNPGSQTPSGSDRVVINIGRTVTADVNNLSLSTLEVYGTLDLATSSGHAFGTISGNGQIRMQGADDGFGTFEDNFPSGDATGFADNTDGGTLVIEGNGLVLNQNRTFNDVRLSLATGADEAILLGDLTVNGDLEIQIGEFQFGDNASTTARTLTVQGDTRVVGAGSFDGSIAVGTANARHQFNVYGDLINNQGTMAFTNRVTADYANEATNGIVDVNFLSTVADQDLICNGTSNFYRIEVDKGSDDTYILDISTDNSANFNLYGYANEGHANVAQLASNANALGLLAGTVKVGLNVNIPALNITGNYNISSAARLWVDGGTVTKSIGTAIVPYGVLQVSSGTLNALVASGLTLRDQGQIVMEGGSLNANQIRTSVLGAGNEGGYYQTGGIVTLNGSSVNGSYYVFNLTFTANTFQMSGGELIIERANGQGGILINSDPENVSVTGGTVIAQMNNTTNFKITSRAEFWNFTIRKTGGGTPNAFLAGDGGAVPDIPEVTAQPLVVKNDLKIEANARLNANSVDVYIGGDLNVAGTYTPGTNTTYIDGFQDSFFNFSNGTVTFNNLNVTKEAANDTLFITTATGTPAFAIGGSLVMNEGVMDYKTFTISALGTVTNHAQIGLSGASGLFQLVGSTAQALSSDGTGTFGNLTINNANGVTLGGGDITVLGELALTSGVFNLTKYGINLEGTLASEVPGDYDVNTMLQTNGSTSNNGLSRSISSTGAHLYPMGVAGKYTPALANITVLPDAGTLSVRPVNSVLSTLNAAPTDALQYYWRLEDQDFASAPTVQLDLYYDNGDVDGLEASYVPGRIYGISTREEDTGGSVNTTNDVINFSALTFQEGDYTAGLASKFTGSVAVFYIASNVGPSGANWDNANTWSTTRGGSGGAGVPGAGDVVIMSKYDATIRVRNQEEAARIIFDARDGSTSGYPRLLIQRNNPYNSTFDVIEVDEVNHLGGGAGFHGCVIDFQVDNTYAGNFPNGDFGDFGEYESALFIYSWQTGNGTITLSNQLDIYPQLWFAGGSAARTIVMPDVDVTVTQRMNVAQQMNIRLNDGVDGDLTIKGNLEMGHPNCCGFRGQLFFPGGSANARTMTVEGDLKLRGSSSNTFVGISNPTSGAQTHRLVLHGNLTIDATGGSMDLGDGNPANTNVELELKGSSNATFTNADVGSSTLQLYRIIMNKGLDTTATFSFDDPFTLTGATDGTDKAIELQNGTLIFNDATHAFHLTTSGDFDIPETAGLEITQGTLSVSGDNSGIILDGTLRINGGTLDMDDAVGNGNNFIEYSASGTAFMDISAGSLTVGSQIRRSLGSTAGVLKYRQTGGTVIVGQNAAPVQNRGVFEVLNPNSEFTYTGGSLTMVRQNGAAPTVAALYLDPDTYDITGTTITMGNGDTPAGQTDWGIYSTIALNNLLLNSTNTPTYKIEVVDLTVNGLLTVSPGVTFDANGNDLTLNGNWQNNGTYVPSGNTTTFSGTGTQTFNGSGSSTFYNLTKANTSTLELGMGITIQNDLRVSSGTFADQGNTVSLLGDAFLDATLTSSGGQGLVFAGTSEQTLNRTTGGTTTLGVVTINNASGVTIPDGNGYDFFIQDNLRLENGVLDIGGSLLELSTTAGIEEVNTFGQTNMVQTNSSFTDNGVKKNFPAIASTTDFTYPIGESKFTPVTFSISALDAGGSLTIRPANELHPAILQDTEAPDPEINDSTNVLQYHWVVTAQGVTNLSGDAIFTYDDSDLATSGGYTVANYIPARLFASNDNWDKAFSTTAFNEGTNEITFPFVSADDASVSGDYTAGVGVNGADVGINGAIPDVVPSYSTTGVGGPFNDAGSWAEAIPAGGPVGGIITVRSGGTLVFNTNNTRLYRTIIEAGAVLEVDGTIGHRLGSVTGEGILKISSSTTSAVLPAGYYENFFSCSGGGLEYGGTGNYDVLGGITQIRTLILSGSGNRNLPNSDLSICENLEVNGATVRNLYNRNVSVLQDAEITGGSFLGGSGNLNIAGNMLVDGGAFDAGSAGNTTIAGNLTLSSGTFDVGSGGQVNVGGNFTYSSGTFNGGSGTARMVFQGTGNQAITGNFTSGNSANFHRLEVNKTTGLVTLGGDVDITNWLYLTRGLIRPGGNTLTLGGTARVTPERGGANSYVDGRLHKTLSNAGDSFFFPIGKGGRYRFASVNSVSTGGLTWEAEYYAAAPGNHPNVSNLTPANPAGIAKVSGNEYWVISDGAAAPPGVTAYIGLSWGATSDVSSVQSEREQLEVMGWNTTNSNWDAYGGGGFESGHSASSGRFQSASLLSFSENIVTLGTADPGNTLPVELVWFRGWDSEEGPTLAWETASEKDNDFFEIQRSTNGQDYEVVGKVQGNGTTQETSRYDFTDTQATAKGTYYYRLRQVDYDGASELTAVVVVQHRNLARPSLLLVVYPNPSHNGQVSLKVAGDTDDQPYAITIHDLYGKQYLDTTAEGYALQQGLQLTLPSSMKTGLYLITIQQGNRISQEKLLITQ